MAEHEPGIRATDDEELATSLWGDGKEYNEQRQQWMPVNEDEGGEESSPGKTSSEFGQQPETSASPTKAAPRSTAPTTDKPSSKARTASGFASSTGGSGKGTA